MRKQLIHRVTWDRVYNGYAYLYGTDLSFTEEGVVFENQRMASGKLICHFESANNYQGKRKSPELPLLIPGRTYWIEVDIDAQPQGRFFLEFTYFNRQEEQIGFEVLRKITGEIHYPEDAFTYTVTLRSAGGHRLVFRSFSLYSFEENKPFKLDKPLEKRYLEHEIPDDLFLVKKLLKTI